MNLQKIAAISATVVLTLIFAAFINRGKTPKTNGSSGIHADGFAVLELFTSEGCSSCPPADEVLARIQNEAGSTPVYVLSYHVDYWNRLGWKDVFSQPQFSKRQYQYNRQFTSQVYTPQLIINGKAEFVGSDETAIRSAIKDALGSGTSTTLSLQSTQQGNKINVDYKLNGSTEDTQLLLALVQKHAVSNVSKGENEGLTLHHAQIVQNLYAFNLASARQGSEQIDVPVKYNPTDWEIIGFLQDPQTGVIKGAARAAGK